MRFILKEITDPTDKIPAQAPVSVAGTGDSFNVISPSMRMEEEGCGCECEKCQSAHMHNDTEEIEISPSVLAGILKGANVVVVEKKAKKKRDRCTSIAATKFDPFPSYNAGSAIARCRRGEIWKKRK